jgi:hypothetical protein
VKYQLTTAKMVTDPNMTEAYANFSQSTARDIMGRTDEIKRG